jgi:ABC-type cobalt transport system substrate-binding protein
MKMFSKVLVLSAGAAILLAVIIFTILIAQQAFGQEQDLTNTTITKIAAACEPFYGLCETEDGEIILICMGIVAQKCYSTEIGGICETNNITAIDGGCGKIK